MSPARQTLTAFVIATMVLAGAPVAHGQVYKCTVGGRTVFSDQPCSPSSKPIDVRPASGRSAAPLEETPTQPAAPVADPVNSSNNPQAVLARVERERLIRDKEHEIKVQKSTIEDEQVAMDRELAELRRKKDYARNNLAGATWEKSISEEMNAVVARYDVRIRALQDEIKRMEADLAELRK